MASTTSFFTICQQFVEQIYPGMNHYEDEGRKDEEEEYIAVKKQKEADTINNDDDEPLCHCNLCHTVRKVMVCMGGYHKKY
jgi:hypothetical protein